MHVTTESQQIRFRHIVGQPGKPDTMSLKRFGLSDREFRIACKHLESIFQAQRQECEHLRTTTEWLGAIPRKLHAYLYERLLQFDPHFATAQITSLETCIDDFEAYRQSLDTSASTDAAVMRDVHKLLGRCPSDVTRIDDLVLQDVLSQLTEELEYSSNTQARIAKNWSTFFAWLIDRKTIEINPCSTLDRHVGRREKDEVLDEWVEQIYRSCKTNEECYWIRLVSMTGCRLSEGLRLRIGDLDFNKNRITLTETKNDRLRINPLYPAIRMHAIQLVHGRDPSEMVLKRITLATCYGWLKSMIDRCGLPHWSPPYNAFRATRVNQLTRELGSGTAGLLLGHSATVARKNYLSVEDRVLDQLAGGAR